MGLFGRKLLNQNEVETNLRKLARRNGKPAAWSDIASGAVIEWRQRRYLVTRGEEHNDFVTLWELDGYMLGYTRMGARANVTRLGNDVKLIARPDEVVMPQFESDIITFVTTQADGAIQCQNLVCGLAGQTFSFPDRAAYLAFREAEEPGKREWMEKDDGTKTSAD